MNINENDNDSHFHISSLIPRLVMIEKSQNLLQEQLFSLQNLAKRVYTLEIKLSTLHKSNDVGHLSVSSSKDEEKLQKFGQESRSSKNSIKTQPHSPSNTMCNNNMIRVKKLPLEKDRKDLVEDIDQEMVQPKKKLIAYKITKKRNKTLSPEISKVFKDDDNDQTNISQKQAKSPMNKKMNQDETVSEKERNDTTGVGINIPLKTKLDIPIISSIETSSNCSKENDHTLNKFELFYKKKKHVATSEDGNIEDKLFGQDRLTKYFTNSTIKGGGEWSCRICGEKIKASKKHKDYKMSKWEHFLGNHVKRNSRVARKILRLAKIINKQVLKD